MAKAYHLNGINDRRQKIPYLGRGSDFTPPYMHRLLLIALATVSFPPLTAQEQLTTAYFPAVGDTLMVNEADLDWAATLDFQPDGGQGLTWRFENPVALIEVSNPVDAAANPEFPDADIVITTGIVNKSYYRFDGEVMNLVGVSARLELLPSFELSTPADPPRATRRAGLRLGDSFTSNTANQVTISPDSIPPEALAVIGGEILSGVDSLRFTTLSRREDVVDASGTVILGSNSYETIRERRREFLDIRLEIKVGFFPWADVTTTAQMASEELAAFLGPQDTVVTYLWWNNDSKEAIARVGIGTEGEIVDMQYKRGTTSTSTGGPRVEQARVALYPNPTTGFTNFEVSGLSGGRYQLTMHNLMGRQMSRRAFSAIGNQTRLLLDVSDFPAGLYLISLRNQQGRILTTRRLKVR